MKSLSFAILRHLGDGDFHSGEKIAQHFGISRASVWQALQPFSDLGVKIFRVPGRGYRLSEPVEWLDSRLIHDGLKAKSALFKLEILDQADSTNRVLLQKSSLGAECGSCVVTELQTAGRGRRGRNWQAALGGSLTFSVLWRFEQGASFLSGLSLAVGVALVRALRTFGLCDAMLKWPNDVLYQNRKLAGILIEMQGDVVGPCAVVIGIGLNLKLERAVFEQIDQPAVDLYTAIQPMPQRNQILASILANLADVLMEFETLGFSRLRHEWKNYHVYQEKPVRLLLPGGATVDGTVLDVAEDGALLLETENRLSRYTSGEVSLRGGM